MKTKVTVTKLAACRITRDARNAEAFDAFVNHMRGFEYGPNETAQAYHFFVAGWYALKGGPVPC